MKKQLIFDAFGAPETLDLQMKARTRHVYHCTNSAYTKFRAGINKFTRRKALSNRVNDIWSGVLADVHQLAKKQRRQKVSLGFC